MLILSQTTDKIKVVLGAIVTTSQAQCVASWRDITATPTYTAGRSAANTNSTTDVDLIAAPAASTQRVIDFISVYNNDTASVTLTVKYDASGTDYILYKGMLATGETCIYRDDAGWGKINAAGDLILVGSTGATGAAGSTGAAGADGKTWHNGSGAPSDVTGVNGDFYLDTTADAYYGPKAAGTWSGTGPTSLIGPAGATGAAGADGSEWYEGTGAPGGGLGVNGDFYLNDANGDVYQKAGGSWSVVANILGPTYVHPNHTGDVTSTGDGATVIANGAVTLTKQADMATASVVYRKTAGTGVPEVQTLSTLKTDLGLTGTNSGDQTLPTRDSLGVDTDDSPQFAGLNIGHASDTTLTRVSAGVIAVEGVNVSLSTHAHTLTGSFAFRIDGAGSVIATGAKSVMFRVPYACTITGWEIVADVSGSIVFDIWKDTYANYPPTNADTITASAKPTVTTAVKATSTTLTGWTTALAAGDYLEIEVESATTITVATLILTITRTV